MDTAEDAAEPNIDPDPEEEVPKENPELLAGTVEAVESDLTKLNPDEPVDPKEKPVAAAGLSLAVAAAAAADPNEKAGFGAAGFSGDAWTAAGVAAAAPLLNAKPLDDEDESVFEPKERVGASDVATDSLAGGNDAKPVDPEPKVCLGAGEDAPAPPKKAPKSFGAPAAGAGVSSDFFSGLVADEVTLSVFEAETDSKLPCFFLSSSRCVL